MASFEPAYERTIRNEGGYRLENVPGDRGGLTYAGIARNANPSWPGWAIIDRGDMNNPQLTPLVRELYKKTYWETIKGDDIKAQGIAEAIYDFAVNAGVRTASKLAQIVVNTTPDGYLGDKTVAALNTWDESAFIANYALAKVARYTEICNRDRSQGKFLLGWLNRTISGLKGVA